MRQCYLSRNPVWKNTRTDPWFKGWLIGLCLLSKSLQSKWDVKLWEPLSISALRWLSMYPCTKVWTPLLVIQFTYGSSIRCYISSQKTGSCLERWFWGEQSCKGAFSHTLLLWVASFTLALYHQGLLSQEGKRSNAMASFNLFPTGEPMATLPLRLQGWQGICMVCAGLEWTSEDLDLNTYWCSGTLCVPHLS